MDFMEAIKRRHAVRSYEDRPIAADARHEMQELLSQLNLESGLSMQLVLNEPKAFSGFMAHYGKFSGVKNYIALIGKKGPGLDEDCGCYGEKAVLRAQLLGLNTCWAAMTYQKVPGALRIAPGEKLAAVIALGYGTTQGAAHPVKPVERLCAADGPMPPWFRRGMEAAQLAPTAMNQQKFHFSLRDGVVSARPGRGFYTKMDLGIAKCHFEIGADGGNWRWA
nr:nitroreductase family protein [uncultured Oscillibacter sp.]